MWTDVAGIEAYLLFVGLLHRDVELLDFDFDVDTPLASTPNYFEQSLLKRKYFGMITAALSKIAATIPVEGEVIAQRSQACADPSPMESISAITPKPTRPVPRQPKRKNQPPRITTPESSGRQSRSISFRQCLRCYTQMSAMHLLPLLTQVPRSQMKALMGQLLPRSPQSQFRHRRAVLEAVAVDVVALVVVDPEERRHNTFHSFNVKYMYISQVYNITVLIFTHSRQCLLAEMILCSWRV